MLKSLDELKDVLISHKDNMIIIYGAGLVGKVILKHILSYSERYKICIAVTDLKDNPGYIMGHRVYAINELSEFKESAYVIIAAMENKHIEMRSYLNSMDFTNVNEISNSLFTEIRGLDPDYSIDIEHNLFRIEKKVNAIHEKIMRQLVSHKYLYNAEYDKKIHGKQFKKYISDEQYFKRKYLNLVRNCDSVSIETVNIIIKRLQQILNKQANIFDVFTVEEQEVLQRIDHEFGSIIKITEDSYCYKNYMLPQNSFNPEIFYYKLGLNIISTIDDIKDKDIIDVGAYVGDSMLVLSPLTKRRVYCFEAVKNIYDNLLKTIELNDKKNIVPVNMALGLENGYLSINLMEEGSSGHGSIKRDGITYTGEESVIQKTLDSYVNENNLNVGLIKVDIEGAEQDFLDGAIETIIQYRPILIISIYHSLDDFFNIKPKLEALNLGYTFKIYRPILKRSIISETLLIAEIIDDNN